MRKSLFENEYAFPGWAIGVGWLLALISSMPIPAFALVHFWKERQAIKEQTTRCMKAAVATAGHFLRSRRQQAAGARAAELHVAPPLAGDTHTDVRETGAVSAPGPGVQLDELRT